MMLQFGLVLLAVTELPNAYRADILTPALDEVHGPGHNQIVELVRRLLPALRPAFRTPAWHPAGLRVLRNPGGGR